MRAIFYKDDNLHIGKKISIAGESAFHLIKVIRIKLGDEILVLDGNGRSYISSTLRIESKAVLLEIKRVKSFEIQHSLDLAICITKSKTMDLIIKMSVELGYLSLYPIISDFSNKLFIYKDRHHKLIESAMIQSNNPSPLKIRENKNLFEINYDDYKYVFYFSAKKIHLKNIEPIERNAPVLVIIGPEGGLSSKEEKFLEKKCNNIIFLSTNILRCETAIPAATGYILSHLKFDHII